MSDLTASDVLAMTNGRNGGDFLNGNGILIILFFLIFGMGGWGGFGGNNAATQGALTRAELTEGLNNQSLQREVGDLSSVINSNANAINLGVTSGFANVQQSLCAGFGNIANGMNQNTNLINSNITALGNQVQQGCCNIQNTIHAEGELTRAVIQQNTIQELRDKIADKDRDLQTATLATALVNQTNTLENWVRTYTNGCGCA